MNLSHVEKERPCIYLRIAVLLILACFAFLVFFRLTFQPPWGDEASSLILARNILHFGVPRAFDGTNLYFFLAGEINRNGNIWALPPLPLYFFALVFRLFGESAGAARFFPAFFSVLSLFLAYHIVRQRTKDSLLALFTLIHLGFSVSFILYSRSAYYYAFAILETLLLVAVLSRDPLRNRDYAALGIIYGAMIYTNLLIACALLPALICFTAGRAWLQKKKRTALFLFTGLPAFAFIAALPLLLSYGKTANIRSVTRGITYGNVVYDGCATFCAYFRDINKLNMLPWVVLIIMFCFFYLFRGRDQAIRHYFYYALFFIFSSVLIISFLDPYPAPWAVQSNADIRYIVHLLPFFSFVSAGAAYYLYRHVQKIAGAIVLIVLVFTNLLSFTAPGIYLYEYCRELVHPPASVYGKIASHIRSRLKPGAYLFVAGDDRASLQYLLPDYLFIGLLEAEDRKARRFENYPAYLFFPPELPDCVISFGSPPRFYDPVLHRRALENTRTMLSTIKDRQIEMEVINLQHDWRGDSMRPDLFQHAFRVQEAFSPSESTYLLYRR